MEKKLCSRCYAGSTGYLSSVLDNYQESYICYNCGTIYSIEGENLIVNQPEMDYYQFIVKDSIKKNGVTENTLSTMVLPTMWSIYQKSFTVIEKYQKTFLLTNVPLFAASGLTTLASAIGIAIGNSTYTLELQKNHNDAIAKMRSEGVSIVDPKFLFLTTSFSKPLHEVNPNSYIVLCIEDSRNSFDKKFNAPVVISLI